MLEGAIQGLPDACLKPNVDGAIGDPWRPARRSRARSARPPAVPPTAGTRPTPSLPPWVFHRRPLIETLHDSTPTALVRNSPILMPIQHQASQCGVSTVTAGDAPCPKPPKPSRSPGSHSPI